ncbi:hypothetical protein ZWY2020_026797 [Hordeum vulgare]|nr:hypothetical protein ZWY2020_026797 [Hordeum vulgare]
MASLAVAAVATAWSSAPGRGGRAAPPPQARPPARIRASRSGRRPAAPRGCRRRPATLPCRLLGKAKMESVNLRLAPTPICTHVASGRRGAAACCGGLATVDGLVCSYCRRIRRATADLVCSSCPLSPAAQPRLLNHR